MKALFVLLLGISAAGAWGQSFFGINVGGGLDAQIFNNSQVYDGTTLGGAPVTNAVFTDSAYTLGVEVFADLSPYFTVKGVLRPLLGGLAGAVTYDGMTAAAGGGSAGFPWSGAQVAATAELKYPWPMGSQIIVAPKAGISKVWALGLGIAGWDGASADVITKFSPLYLTGGLDVNFLTNKGVFYRLFITGGWAWGSNQGDGFYGQSGTGPRRAYQVAADLGFDVGWSF